MIVLQNEDTITRIQMYPAPGPVCHVILLSQESDSRSKKGKIENAQRIALF